jgi:hypothetical protein
MVVGIMFGLLGGAFILLLRLTVHALPTFVGDCWRSTPARVQSVRQWSDSYGDARPG